VKEQLPAERQEKGLIGERKGRWKKQNSCGTTEKEKTPKRARNKYMVSIKKGGKAGVKRRVGCEPSTRWGEKKSKETRGSRRGSLNSGTEAAARSHGYIESNFWGRRVGATPAPRKKGDSLKGGLDGEVRSKKVDQKDG